MIHRDMTVTEFVKVLWFNRTKVAVLLLAIAFGPGLYSQWQAKRAAEQFEADRKSVPTDASITGAFLMSAWKSCERIGIVNDMARCAAYEGRLLQELAAPPLAKMAMDHSTSYYKKCERFYSTEHCRQLLDRAFWLSYQQGKE